MALDLYIENQNSTLALLGGLRIAIANANNLNATAYKSSQTSFTTVYAKVLQGGTETTNPMTFGSSMTVGATRTDFSQGNIGFGNSLDVAITGEGFLQISASADDFGTDSPKLLTRVGSFFVDFNNEFLVDDFGRKVYGYEVNQNGDRVNDTLVPIQTDGETDIGFIEGGILVNNFQAAKSAEIAGEAPPTQTRLYRLALTTVNNKQGLVLQSGGAYKTSVATGPLFESGIAGDGVFGEILAEALESSNTDIAKVSLDLALLNRGFSAVQGTLDDINKIIGGLISKLGAL